MVREIFGHLILLAIGMPAVYFCSALTATRKLSLYFLIAAGYLCAELLLALLLMWSSFLLGFFSPWLILGELLLLSIGIFAYFSKTRTLHWPALTLRLSPEQLLLFFVFAMLVVPSLVYSYVQPLLAWDARSIWFFHGKAFFFDNAISLEYLQNPNYLWSHPDYPVFLPLLSVFHAAIRGEWNEIHCKSFLFAHWLSCLAVLCMLLRWLRVREVVIFAALAAIHLGFAENSLIGYADSTWNIAFCIGILATLGVFQPPKKAAQTVKSGVLNGPLPFSLLAVLGFSIASMTKTEGLLSTLLSVVAMLIVFRQSLNQQRTYFYPLVLALSFSGVAWRLYCLMYNIHGEYAWLKTGLAFLNYNEVTQRAVEIAYSGALLFNKHWGLCALPMVILSLWLLLRNVHQTTAHHAAKSDHLFLSFIYAILGTQIFFSYLLTPLKLSWHLHTSFPRVAGILLCYAVLLVAFFLGRDPMTKRSAL